MSTSASDSPLHPGSGPEVGATHGDDVHAVRKVDFVVGGVQKGGSSALASYMAARSQICLARDLPGSGSPDWSAVDRG